MNAKKRIKNEYKETRNAEKQHVGHFSQKVTEGQREQVVDLVCR